MIGGRDTLPPPTVGVSRWRRFRAHFDWPLLLAVLAVVGIGLFNLYSATHKTQHSDKFDLQLQFVAIGMAAFFAMTFLDYRALVRLGWVALILGVALIVAVYVVGYASKGAQRWIGYGPLRIQPSELAKIAVILYMARVIQEHDHAEGRLTELLTRLAPVFVPVVLIVAQPDLGSGVLLGLVVLSIGFVVLRSYWPAVAVSLTGLAGLPLLWDNMHAYQKSRILAFLDPAADPTGAGWHTRQSVMAVGSGRVTGKGAMEGTQNQFDYLPEHWTDFPFSVWAEEWGFLGSVALLVLFGFLIFWTINVAMVARDKSGVVICVGVAAMLFWHTLVNVMMVLGMAPVVGVTLPFISYGRSSLLTFFLAMGLVSSVSLRRHGY